MTVMTLEKNDERLRTPDFLQEGRLRPRATSVPALKEGIYYKNKEEAEFIQVLNGEFKFCYRAEDDRKEFYHEAYDDSEWDVLPVPSMWQYHGYGKPKYPNVEYPIPFNPPYVCCENPVGYYRKRFYAKKTAHSILYFGGVDNAFYVYLNGEYVGFSKGSRIPAEFDVSDKLKDGDNLLCVKVFTYSDATYLENQDMLLASGIFRDVMLYHLGETYIWDYYVRTEGKQIQADVTLEGNNLEGCIVELAVGEPSGKAKWIYTTAEMCNENIQRKKQLNSETARIKLSVEMDSPLPWNAETPNLYDVRISLIKNDMIQEIHSKKVGFVSYETAGNRMLVNGQPITIKGINRHEHDPKNGRAISVEMIEKELRIIKEHNFNAIRCAHYPNHPAFYEVASELGLYVMDEADLETHGCFATYDQGFLSKQPSWFASYKDRVKRMVERDKNETCIFIWSMGNEHGSGENLDKCAEYVRNSPYKKPVYRGCDNPKDPQVNEFRDNAYFKMESLVSYPEEGKPVMLIEYAHAMGNSPGLLEDTWDYVYTHRHIAGGFVWEFKNHGFYQEDEAGKVYYQYGGDFDDVKHWSNFTLDGFCLSDGTAKSSLRECKSVFSPTYVTCDGSKVYLTNTNDFRNLDYITLAWELCEDYKVLRSGQYQLPAVKPYECVELELDTFVETVIPGAKYMVNLRFYDENSREIAFKQAVLRTLSERKEAYSSKTFDPVVKSDGTKLEIIGEEFRVGFEDGILNRYVKSGVVLLDSKMKFNFFRAPTDNDGIVGFNPRWIAKWEDILLQYFDFWAEHAELETKEDRVIYRVNGKAFPEGRFTGFFMNVVYTIYGDGTVLIEITGRPYGRFHEVLPRIGVYFELEKKFGEVSWYGRGEDENYSDRKAHCNLGYYTLPVESMNFIYDVPQECGTRSDTSFVKITDGKNAFSVIGSDQFAFSYHDFTLKALTEARHCNELKRANKNYLYIDYCMRGLGSHSCGPDPEECYELRPHDFRFAFAVTGEVDKERLLDLSRKDFGSKTEKLSGVYEWKRGDSIRNIVECDLD